MSGGLLIGTTASLQGAITNNAAVTFDQTFDGAYAGVMSGTGGLTKTGTGTLTLSGANTYTGGTFVDGGILRAAIANALGTGTLTVASGATLDLNGFNQAVGSLSGAGNFTLGSASLSTGGNNADSTFAGGLSGSGSLTKTGTGVLTLSGQNTYTGGTTVSGGSLVGTTSSLQGNILNHGTLVFDQLLTGTYSGVMSGTGGLEKKGTGALTLSGANSYTGGTTVWSGSLIGNSTSLQGNIFSNGLVVFNQPSAGTYSGVLSGTGGLLKEGAGTLTLAGASTYTGGTTIGGGVLRAGSPNVFATNAPLAIGAGTTLDLNGFSHTLNALSGTGFIQLGTAKLTTGTDGGSDTLDATISGTGTLEKAGTGTLTLTGTNTYTGGTTVSGGTLAGTSTSLQGNILNNSLVVFDQGFNGTYAGWMSGSGALQKAGAGTLTLTGTNTYAGGTVITGGSLIGTAASVTGPITNHGSLLLGGSADETFNGSLSGTGAFTKTGSGTLTLSGLHAFSGLTTVSQGGLFLNGQLGGGLRVLPGASFSGNGRIFGSTFVQGSLEVVLPGGSTAQGLAARNGVLAATGDRLNTPPPLTIDGNLVTEPGSVLTLPIGPGPYPSLLVGGTASLNGTALDVRAIELGTERRLSFNALAGLGGLTMTNPSVSTADPLLIPALRQDGTSLFVTLLNLRVPLRDAVTDRRFAPLGGALDILKQDMSGDRGFVIRELLALDDEMLNDAMRAIAGEIHATSRHVAVRSSEAFTDLVRSQLADRDDESDEGRPGGGGRAVRWWGQYGREHGDFEKRNGALGGTMDVSDGAAGFDVRLSDRWLAGGGGGFGSGQFGLNGLGASAEVSTPRAFGVLGFKPKGFGIRGGASLGRSNSKSKRAILIIATLPPELGGLPLTGGIDRQATSEEVTVQNDEWTEYSDNIDYKTYRIDWMVGVRRARFSQEGFTESGAGALSLASDGQTFSLNETDVKVYVRRRKGGLRPYAETMIRRSSGMPFNAEVRFAEVPNSDFASQGLPRGANSFLGRAGLNVVRMFGTVTFEYRFRKADGQFIQAGDVRFRW